MKDANGDDSGAEDGVGGEVVIGDGDVDDDEEEEEEVEVEVVVRVGEMGSRLGGSSSFIACVSSQCGLLRLNSIESEPCMQDCHSVGWPWETSAGSGGKWANVPSQSTRCRGRKGVSRSRRPAPRIAEREPADERQEAVRPAGKRRQRCQVVSPASAVKWRCSLQLKGTRRAMRGRTETSVGLTSPQSQSFRLLVD